MASLRNILVHDYLTIDPNLLYQDLQTGLEAIEVFIREVEKKFGMTIEDTKKMKE